MDPGAKQTVQMAALGRPFSLGMLYDCRKDSIIPGMTLWDHDDLLNHIGERPQYYNDFEMVASESIDDKFTSLNVGASLKLSVLFGLFETNGSAKYLQDDKKSKNQSRVSLKYEATTKFRELSMDHLGGSNIKYPDVLDKGIATHVVTAILYGAQAIFVFDREVSEEENHQVVEGNLKFMINMILCIKGDISLKMNDEILAKDEKFSCKFHGDFSLDKNPVSYQDAVQVYQSLPRLLGAKRENVVPLKVWLLPLTCLDSSATQLVRQISTAFVRRVQTVIEDFSELEMRSNDAIKTMIAEKFPEVGKKLKMFKKLCCDLKEKFQHDFAKNLPLIRGGVKREEEVLPTSNMDKLMKWMDCAEKEIYILQSFINMKNIKIVPSENDLYKETPSAERVLCFVFPPLGSAEPYLPDLSTYLNETDKPVPLETKEVLDAIRHKAKLFGDFSEANKENKNIKFLIVSLPNKAQTGSSIHLYKDGFAVTEDFEPPSKPETVKERNITHNSVIVDICPPRFGAKNVTSYSVEYCVSGEDEWQETRASTAKYVTVRSLKPATQYRFRCRAVTSEGVGPARDVHHSIKTLSSLEPVYPAITIHVCTKTCEFPQTAQSVLEDFTKLEMRCNDAMKTTIAQQFPQIGEKLKTFKEVCSVFKMEFQLNVAKKLPSILEGGEEEVMLADILKKTHSSTFNNTNLNKWLDCKEKEMSILKFLTKMMNNTKIVRSQNDLHEEILSVEHAVCFIFTSLGSAEPYLSALSNYLNETPEPDDPQDTQYYDIEREQWYASPEVLDAMRNKAKLFSDFAEANKEKKNTKFLTVGLTNETEKGSSIYLYKDPLSVKENFELPSKPETVTAGDVTHSSVTLKICPPRFGSENISFYSVEYCVSGEDGWKQKSAPKAEEVTVSGLTPNTEYMFRCRAVTSVGVGPASEVSGPIKTLPCSPPGKPQVETNSSEISVSWEKPAEIGQDVQILSYIVEYAQMDKGVKDEDLQWNQMMSGAEKGIIPGLQSETEYAVRVRCDCGGAGRSKESITVNVCTTKREFARLADFLKHIGKSLSSGSPSLYKLPLTEEDIDIDGCRRYNFGHKCMRQNRTIMLLGATGSGKSTLIDGMINYIVGVEWKDDFRFKLIDEDQSKSQAESQTSEVTVYKINHQDGFKIPFSLTIVDTPGFGDTRGIRRDKEITEQIRRLFTSVNGVSEIDAVCFVTQASLARLTATQRYAFDSVLSIFGKDVAENIQMLVTFADGKQPPVLEAINVSGIPCPKNEIGLPVHFKFNNSALFAGSGCTSERAYDDSDEDDDMFDEMFRNMDAKSLEEFFTDLGKMTTNDEDSDEDSDEDDDKLKEMLWNMVAKISEEFFTDLGKMTTNDEDSDEDDTKFVNMYWNMGAKSMEEFFTALGKMKTKSLLMTQEILKERKHLETAVDGLQPQVKAGLAKLEEIKLTIEKIREHETAMTSNENYEIEVDKIKPVKIQLTKKGEFITNCQKCSVTCHYPCAIANNNEKYSCASMDEAGMCTVCPGKCIWCVHFNQTYKWEYVKVKEKQTLQELREKYENATKEKLTFQDLIEMQEEEIVQLQERMVALIDQSAQCITRLQEIALRPNPLTTPEYIDMLIEGEKSEAKKGYHARIQSLEAMKEKAKIISKVAK